MTTNYDHATQSPVAHPTLLYKNLPSTAVVDVALGMEPAEKILARYDLTPSQIASILAFPPFQTQVERCRAELESSGVVFKTKNALLADMMQEDIYRTASNKATPLAQKLEAYRTFARFGGLDPSLNGSKDTVQTNGSGIVLNINFGQTAPSALPKTVTIDAEPQHVPQLRTLPSGDFADLFDMEFK